MKQSNTILILGSGFVASRLAMQLRNQYQVVLGYRRTAPHIPGTTSIPCDVLERNWLKRMVYTIYPSVIIYAAGKNQMEWAERDGRECERIHAGGPASACAVADILQPKFIHLSNNYVFDGKRGNFKETDPVLPLTALGKAKLSGENFIRGKSLNYVIIRSSPLYGLSEGKHLNFLERVRDHLERGQRMDLNPREVHAFAPVAGLVDLVQRVLESNIRNKVIHYGGLSKLSWFDFGRAFAKRFNYNPNILLPAKTEFPQFYDYSLNSTNAVNSLKIRPLTLDEGFDLFEKELVLGPKTLKI